MTRRSRPTMKPFTPRGSFLSDPPARADAPLVCTCRRLRGGWHRAPTCPRHGDPLAARAVCGTCGQTEPAHTRDDIGTCATFTPADRKGNRR